jgi:hypothetical protein
VIDEYKTAGQAITHPAITKSNHEAITAITIFTKPQVSKSRTQSHKKSPGNHKTPGPFRGLCVMPRDL